MAARPRPSTAPLTTPASSASPELKAMVFCFVDQCLTACAPRMHTLPACGAPSTQGPGEVSVHKDSEGGPFVLPREV
eukprot:12528309-Alexandrium_andersonii.AAC.1